MKKILFLMLFICNFPYLPPAVAAESTAEPINLFTTNAIAEKNSGEITVPEMVGSFLTLGKYFNEKYPNQEIEKDFSEEVAAIFPRLTLQEVYDREQNIRDAVKAYRYFSAMYDDIKGKMIVPDAPPLMVEDSEYEQVDHGREYIESSDLVVVEDFKKVLSYGNNKRDFEAFSAKFERDRAKAVGKSDVEKLSGLLTKLEWKKLPYYGVIYEDPFTGSEGMGEWVVEDKIKVRLISEYSTINNQKHFLGAIHFALPKDEFVVAQKYHEFVKPQFDFSASENLQNISGSYPLPNRLLGGDHQDTIVYKNNFAIPLEIEVDDVNQPLLLQAKINFTVCSFTQQCRTVELNPILKLASKDGFYSSVNNFITQSLYNIPTPQGHNLSLSKAVVDEQGEDNAQTLRLEFKTENMPTNFDTFVESEDDITFLRPRIAIGDNKVIVRLEPADKNINLIGKNFTITARLSPSDHLRQTITAQKASVFDYMPDSLSLGILMLGVLGGLILNFMPCVFPVLSIKLLSLTKFGANNSAKVRKNFLLTILGIFLAFLLIACLLAILKSIGYAIGWGMQFQNATFLVLMIFIIAGFLTSVWGWINIHTPDWISKYLGKNTDKESLLHFLTGVFVVVMATPCTAPYLGTAIGFALTGSVSSIFAIMFAVALGLSLPYLIVAMLPDSAAWLPKPGRWMNHLNLIMALMLILTIIWLFSVLYVQTNFWTCFRLGVYLLLFVLLVGFRGLLLDMAEVADYEPHIKTIIKKIVRLGAWVILAIVFAIAIFDVRYNFNKIQAARIESKSQKINYPEITKKIQEGKIVIVSVGADWCLTCKYNDVTVFSTKVVEDMLKKSNAELIEVDWTSYDEEVLQFMEKYGRKGLPFNVVFSPMIPDGMVLPEVLSEREFNRIINNIAD